VKATWSGTVVAEREDTVVVEGNHYVAMVALDRSLVPPEWRPARGHDHDR
jgi:hypothetical protein